MGINSGQRETWSWQACSLNEWKMKRDLKNLVLKVNLGLILKVKNHYQPGRKLWEINAAGSVELAAALVSGATTDESAAEADAARHACKTAPLGLHLVIADARRSG